MPQSAFRSQSPNPGGSYEPAQQRPRLRHPNVRACFSTISKLEDEYLQDTRGRGRLQAQAGRGGGENDLLCLPVAPSQQIVDLTRYNRRFFLKRCASAGAALHRFSVSAPAHGHKVASRMDLDLSQLELRIIDWLFLSIILIGGFLVCTVANGSGADRKRR